MRRLRRSEGLRRMVRETPLSPSDFIYPVFVTGGRGERQPIPSMPGQSRLSVDQLPREASELRSLDIPAILLFGLPETKDAVGSGAWQTDGIVQQAVQALKDAQPELVVITDVCLCEYTDHGHCGVLNDDGSVANDESVELLAQTALSQAAAGADVIAPSDMMDGRVGAIRRSLDHGGFEDRTLLAYSAKFASGFYGPFRDAADSAPQFGDRRGYQMDPANGREAMRAIARDLAEGADMVMVKPALAYLDLVREARQRFDAPLAAYNVSGEYAMLKAAAANGWIDEERVVLETLTGIRRAGADLILTYHAKEAARWLARRSG
ncbi:MAG: porphobilinogen synthase [Chloroflexi bacterium]|nr:porphobilinogen synthase [Chloroflexota bacterium]MYF81557.1 porphobilinogen synthase [Chloroflexota bacterium]MYI05353.1 porphobilinogen synthase [Chloroflexota bacterium]